MCDKKNSIIFNDTECIVLSPNFKLIDESQVLLRVPRKNNMYSVDLKNVVPKRGLTCLFAKATSDESKVWHRRLEAVNTACYVQNRVLVVKPHNKTTYELFHGRTPILSFMRPFGCPVTILNTIDHFGKFDGKADEVSLFSESTPNVVGSGPDWLFDIDALTRTMNYEPIVAGTQSNGFAGTKASDNAGQARKETEPVKYYILLPLWTADPPYSQDPKSSHDDGSKPSSDDGKKVDEDPRKDSKCNDQEKEDNVNNTNNVNAASTNEVNAVDDGAEADMNNFDITIQVSPIPTIIIHKDHPLDQEIGDLQSATQTRRMSKNLKEHGFVSTIQQRTNHKDLQNCLFTCFLSQEEPKKGTHKKKGLTMMKSFSSVVRIEAIRLYLAYASFKDFVVYQLDVKSVFLYGKIKEEVCVYQPPGFEDPDFPDKVYKVKKHCMNYIKPLELGDILLVQVYVDDIIFGSTKKELCNAFEKLMHEKF
ncbi:putative ribonuclease H-like domain-containing protein [Tanacetum coccineum]